MVFVFGRQCVLVHTTLHIQVSTRTLGTLLRGYSIYNKR